MLGHQGVLVDEDCILGLDLRDAAAGPGHVDRTQARGILTRLLPSCDQRFPHGGSAAPAFSNSCLGDVSIKRGAELGQCSGGGTGYRQIAREAADRVAGKERIDTDMHHFAIMLRRLEARDPRDVAFEDEDRIGAVEIWTSVIAQMAGMVGGERQMARPMLDNRQREALGEFAECGDGGRIAPGTRGHNERVLRSSQDAGGLVDRMLVGAGRGGSNAARRTVVAETEEGCGQHFTRQ